jgi:hypothetical protein
MQPYRKYYVEIFTRIGTFCNKLGIYGQVRGSTGANDVERGNEFEESLRMCQEIKLRCDADK